MPKFDVTSLLSQRFKNDGLRLTSCRLQLIKLLCKINRPVAVREILEDIKVHKTTLYREMETLISKGYIREIDFGDGTKRYELNQGSHHHHLVCIRCKSVTEYDLHDDFSKEEKLIARKNKFTVLRHSLEFFGICRTCESHV